LPAFVGSDKNKLGPAAHLKGTMKRPARSGDLVGGGAEESIGNPTRRGFLGMLGGAALAASGLAHAQSEPLDRVTGNEYQMVNGVRQLNIDGKIYTWAGRGVKPEPDVKIVKKVIGVQGMIGIRGGNDVTLMLGDDGRYYSEGFGSITPVREDASAFGHTVNSLSNPPVDMQKKAQEDLKNKVYQDIVKFYKPVVQDIEKEKVDNYVEQAKEILRKANDPTLKEKLLDIFQKGKQNPYLQSGIITITGSLVAGGILSYGQRLGLNAGQTNILLQSVMNSVIPTLVSVLNGKNWTDTVKYVLTSAGLGTGIAAIAEEDNDYSLKEDISHEEVDLIMSNLIEKIITNEAIQNNKQ